MGIEYSKDYRTDIVIVGWNRDDLTKSCIASIGRNTYGKTYHIIYVDNGSDMPPPLNAYSATKVYLPTNTGFCHGTNVGIALSLLSDYDYVLLLNNDTVIPDGDPTWLERLILPMQEDKSIGAVGAVSDKVYGAQRRDKAIQIGNMYHFVPVLIGFCLLLRKEAIAKVGLLDERFSPGNYEDFDYSLRLQKEGYKLAVAESVFIHHEMHASFKALEREEPFSELLARNKQKLIDKWGAAELKAVGL